jgi:molybdopterin-containing oxidoreductase family iron-sulfur binding subunit
MAACPYGVRVFNWGKPKRIPDFDYGRVEARPKGVVEKCTFCVHRVDEGLDPACVVSCPAHARIFGDLNDPDSAVSAAIRDRGGEQLLEEKGTKPQVFYLGRRRRKPL